MRSVSAAQKMGTSQGAVSQKSTLRLTGEALLGGLLLTAAFPLAVPALGPDPILDALPREACVLPAAAFFYREARAGRATFAGLAGFVHFLTLLFWLYVAMSAFGRMPWFQALPVLSLLAAYCALYLVLLVPIFALLERRVRLPLPVLFAAALVATEWLRSQALTGFPWGLWGYSQARNLPLANLAAWGGVYAISALIAVLAGVFYDAWRTRDRRLAVAGLLALLLGHGLGAARMALDHEDEGSEVLEVALLQGNIRQELKNRGHHAGGEISTVYRALVREARDADLIVWPESAWPYPLDLDVERFAVESEVPMIVGAVAGRRSGDEAPIAHNSSAYVQSGGRITGRQHKLHLVPFGEYVPLRWLLPVERVVPGLVDFSPGATAAPVGRERLGVTICYDGIFPEIARSHVRAGARLLANLTNDAWYGATSGPLQHLDFYVFRAIETGRYVLRATNTGYSAVVSPTGVVRGRTRLDTRGIGRGVAYARRQTTLYVWLGDWVVALALGVVAGALLAAARDRLTGARTLVHLQPSITEEPVDNERESLERGETNGTP